MQLKELRKKLDSINITSLVDESIKETSNVIIDAVRGQIEHGMSSEDYLPVYKSQKYASKKQQLGSKAPPGITDLKLTGSFLNKLYIRIEKYNILIRSRDKKNNVLLKKYGSEIFVMNETNEYSYINILRDKIQKRIKNELFK